jgi:hypothetical protein
MNIQEFIQQSIHRKSPYNNNRAHLDQPGFSTLYVRYGERFIEGRRMKDFLDLASIEAVDPGRGAFKELVRTITENYPRISLYVENVLLEQFRAGLLRLGFKRVPTSHPESPCYYMIGRRADLE